MKTISWNPRKLLVAFIITWITVFTMMIFIGNVNQGQRILCLITTQPKYHKTRAEAVKNTWGQLCDVLYFVSSESDPYYPTFAVKGCDAEDYNHLWCKIRNGIIYGYNNFVNDFDWFLKADDDTYVIIDNLKYYLKGFHSSEPLVFGLTFKYQKTIYSSGGLILTLINRLITLFVSYRRCWICEFNSHLKLSKVSISYFSFINEVFSKETVSRLVAKLTDENTNRKWCHTRAQRGAEDLDVGKYGHYHSFKTPFLQFISKIIDRCLDGLGVKYVDTRDSLGRHRFLPFQPFQFLNPNNDIYAMTPWLGNYTVHRIKQVKKFNCPIDKITNYVHFFFLKKGFDCCSDNTISFHYITAPDMYVLHFFVKQLKVRSQ